LRQLLNQTGSIGDRPETYAAVTRHPRRRWTMDEILGRVDVFQAPGKFLYMDANYQLAGKAIEKATGTTVGAAMRRELLELCTPRATLPCRPLRHPPPESLGRSRTGECESPGPHSRRASPGAGSPGHGPRRPYRRASRQRAPGVQWRYAGAPRALRKAAAMSRVADSAPSG